MLTKCLRDVPGHRDAFAAYQRLRQPRAERMVGYAQQINKRKRVSTNPLAVRMATPSSRCSCARRPATPPTGGSTTTASIEEMGRMGKIVSSTFVSLDGVINHMDRWHFDFIDSESDAFALQQLQESDALLMGRHTHDVYASAWPTRSGTKVASCVAIESMSHLR